MARTIDPEHYEARRRHLLAAAAACFAATGYAQTTVAQICARAGVSSGSLFHYFPTKRAVFHALFEQDGRDTAALVDELAERTDAWQAVLDLVDHLTAAAADESAAGLTVELIAHAARDPQLAAIVERNDAVVRDALTGLYERCAEQGRVDGQTPPATAARWTLALADALFLRLQSDPHVPVAEERATLRTILGRFVGAPATVEPAG